VESPHPGTPAAGIDDGDESVAAAAERLTQPEPQELIFRPAGYRKSLEMLETGFCGPEKVSENS